MANYEKKNGTGVAFRNAKSDPRHPDWKGNILTPKGEELSIALWARESQNGKEYFSISVSEPYNKEQNTPKQQTTGSVTTKSYPSTYTKQDDEPSDLPF